MLALTWFIGLTIGLIVTSLQARKTMIRDPRPHQSGTRCSLRSSRAAIRRWALTALLPCLLLLPGLPDTVANPKDSQLSNLLEVQTKVQRSMERATAATVAVESVFGSGSGVIVSADGLVLTAGHVSMTPGRKLTVVFSTGKRVEAEALGRSSVTDAGMARITEKGPWPFVDMAEQESQLNPGDWCFALGHPQGFEQARGAVLRVGRILARARDTIQSDCTLFSGDSGGPLFNLAGEVVGIHSRIGSASSGNYHVPVIAFERDWRRMERGEQSMMPGRGRGGWIGLASRDHRDGGVTITAAAPESPATEAGLLRGDVIKSIDGEPVLNRAGFSREIARRSPGDEVQLVYERDGETNMVRLILGHQPFTQ